MSTLDDSERSEAVLAQATPPKKILWKGSPSTPLSTEQRYLTEVTFPPPITHEQNQDQNMDLPAMVQTAREFSIPGGQRPANQPQHRRLAFSSLKPTTNRQKATEQKVVGLKTINRGMMEERKQYLENQESTMMHLGIPHRELPHDKDDPADMDLKGPSVEYLEDVARQCAVTNPFKLLFLGNLAALKVFLYFLVTVETIVCCILTAGLTVYWYIAHADSEEKWSAGSLDFILLAFAVTSPISAAIGMAFTRRERALVSIGNLRSFSYHLYLAHALWDWNENGGRAAAAEEFDFLEHCDAVLAHIIGIGDELSRFLTLPSASRSRHRMTRQGRREAAKTVEAAYYLLESMSVHRSTRLAMYSERIKKVGLPSGEISRMRQYERFISDSIEQLRMVGHDLGSIGYGIAFGLITALGITALFESLQVIEDPFTAFLALDGIDVREEFEVLNFTQLIETRKLVFPHAPDYPLGRRAALMRRRRVEDMDDLMSARPSQTAPPSERQPSFGSDITFQEMFVDLTGLKDAQTIEHELGLPFDEDEPTGRETSYALFSDDASTFTRRTHNRARSIASGGGTVGGGGSRAGHHRTLSRSAIGSNPVNRPRLLSGSLSARMND